ncbi:MAG: glycosyltransferase family 2 protein [Kiloniellales bacterium]|nr:glycosyltransferase family 2 protein [Kiloniellales bacterium]
MEAFGCLDATSRSSVSIVVPAYNEEAVLETFHQRLTAVLEQLPLRSEIVYVNDGSRDTTLETLYRLREGDPRVTVLDLSRNFGKEIALTAGIDHSIGDAVVVIDADLQDPPELIPELIAPWRERGVDVVYAKRKTRADDAWLKKVTAVLFYKLMLRVGEVPIPPDTGDFRLLSRRAVEGVKRLRERHRFMKGIFAWVGFSQEAIAYDRDRRYAGNTKWNYWKLWNLAIEGITSATTAPLRLSSYMGLLIALLAFLGGVWIIIKTIIFGDPVQGWPSMMVVILFLGGVQMVVLGVMGEYLGRLFNESKGRPLYLLNDAAPSELAQMEKEQFETSASVSRPPQGAQ